MSTVCQCGVDTVKRLLDKALRIPTADNIQPWSFRWDGQNLSVYHNDTLALHPLNNANQISFFNLGFLIEAVRIAASVEYLETQVQLFLGQNPTYPGVWATFQFSQSQREPDKLAEVMAWRTTDRRLYQGGSLDHPVFLEIKAAAVRYEGSRIYFQSKLNRKFLAYMVKGEEYFWTQKTPHRLLFKFLRFTQTSAKKTGDGMPWEGLGIGFLQSRMLKLCKVYQVQQSMNRLGFLWQIKGLLKRQLASSAGVACISVRSFAPEHLVEAGQLSFRAWLQLNQAGFGVQPLSVGALATYNWLSATLSPDTRPKLVKHFATGEQILREQFQLEPGDIPFWMFRTGLSTPLPEQDRTYRRNLDEVFSSTVS
jgi:hypothetical protein